MKIVRVILAILLIIPIWMLVDAIILRPVLPFSNDGREVAYLLIGIPILVMNTWAWFHPEIIKS